MSDTTKDRRNTDWQEYERLKAAWLAENPAAPPEEVTRALRAIANELGL